MKCDLTLKPRGNIWKARELSHHSLVITINSLTILPAVFSLWFSQCLNSTALKKKKKIKLTETSSDLLSLVHFHLLSQYHPGTSKKTEPSLISSLPHPEPTHIFSYLCLPLTIHFSERGLPPIPPKLICKYSSICTIQKPIPSLWLCLFVFLIGLWHNQYTQVFSYAQTFLN